MTDAAHNPAPPAWQGGELADPHHHADKHSKVRRMFAAIAGSYDLNNRVHSFGRDQAWRRYAVKVAGVKPTDHVLDVACGTGDLSRAFADAGPARVVGLDFTREMLDVAEMKQRRDPGSHGNRITYVEGDAQKLPFADAAFDIVSIAFGIRNVADPAKAIAEFFRVLRPGGRLVILEFDKVRIPVVGWVSDFYTRRIMPHTATLISGDRSGAYKYLPASVETFLDREQLGGVLRQTRFGEVSAKPLTLGVCICHRAVKLQA
ncbi:MAG: bifunctional demethylmenaquinone methyltransferase/2-methoxy-6-polyprenyl-1,4-benzoquinol methylase UbiE [Phycisphaerales bacterium]